ncbi:U3 small nucleolar ribonucleoprotein complex, subunit Mpp10 [Scheffersomyces xylosifermentans]|uniref:U3 small nucleolar ribonucleoprotein complex, subunit Mpp10 n=1 Tax=Scheffersomyces xylosifermentans TaxID=1304137 RepID=UPI00315D9BAE
MSQDILEVLRGKPQSIFELYKPVTSEITEGDETSSHNIFNDLTKTLLDPITKKYSVLDEIYVSGLDSTQVFGQTKMVLDGVGESLLFKTIPELKEKYKIEPNQLEASDLEEELSSEEDNLAAAPEEFEDEDEEDDQNNKDEEEEEDSANEDEEGEQELEDSDEETTLHEQVEQPASNEETEVSENERTSNEIKKDAFGLNDGFFDIDEFNKQIVQLEDDNEDDDEEEIDYFGSLSEDGEDEDEEEMPYYDDFYDKPGSESKAIKSKQASGEEDEEDEDDEEAFGDFNEEEYDNAVGSAMLDLFDDEDEVKTQKKSEQNLSSYEKQQQQIQAEIARLEAELVAEKKWTMKGEIASKDRPQDSLLDDPDSANLEFDRTSKPVPIVTQETTEALEDLIRRRIKNEEFDEVPKRLITDVSKFHNKRKFELSEQKSSKSLAEIYEDQYNNVDDSKEVSEEIQKQHDEISELFTKVTHKLDALCSAHFIPKPHQFKTIDIKVSDNAASISMEDAAPLHVSSEATLAPQEIYKIGDDRPAANGAKGRSEVQLKSGLSYSKDELSRDDKQRLRRANKRKKSKEFNKRKELQEAQQKQAAASSKGQNGHKRQKVGEVIDTLSKAKNITVIGKKGEMRDVKGNVKKQQGAQTSGSFKL